MKCTNLVLYTVYKHQRGKFGTCWMQISNKNIRITCIYLFPSGRFRENRYLLQMFVLLVIHSQSGVWNCMHISHVLQISIFIENFLSESSPNEKKMQIRTFFFQLVLKVLIYENLWKIFVLFTWETKSTKSNL